MEMPVLVFKEGSVFVTECPITSVSTFGETEEEALGNHKEAMELYLEDLPESEIKEIESFSLPAGASLAKLSLNSVKS